MKKIIDIKEIIMIIVCVAIVTFSTNIFAIEGLGLVSGEQAETIDANQYQTVQNETPSNSLENKTTNNVVENNTTNNATNITNITNTNNTANNKTKVYNTNNTSELPQTGIEDYNIGILLIICVASAIYTYKKINDYKNI